MSPSQAPSRCRSQMSCSLNPNPESEWAGSLSSNPARRNRPSTNFLNSNSNDANYLHFPLNSQAHAIDRQQRSQ